MTNPRTIALGALALAGAALLVTLVASSDSLWTSWPGSVVRFGGFVGAAAGLYALAARWDHRAAHDWGRSTTTSGRALRTTADQPGPGPR